MVIDDTEPWFFIRHADALHLPPGPHEPSRITRVSLTAMPRRDPLGNFEGPNSERAANSRLLLLAGQYEGNPARRPLEVQVETALDNGVVFVAKHRIGPNGWGQSIREHLHAYLDELHGRRFCADKEKLDALLHLVGGKPDQVDLAFRFRTDVDELTVGNVKDPAHPDAPLDSGEPEYYAQLSLALRRGIPPRLALQEAQSNALDVYRDDQWRQSIDAARAKASLLLTLLGGNP